MNHTFDTVHPGAESSTRMVMWITLAVMLIEVIAGWVFNSMALLADGWNMGSHAVATGLSVFAYKAVRYYEDDPSFVFGPWKIEVLSGFTGAILLLTMAGLMIINSIERFFITQPIYYKEAIIIVIFGLLINILCAIILSKAKTNNNHDLNLKSIYIHVITDAITSILAIVALIGGLLYNWVWLDPVMGIVGGILIAIWAKALIITTSKILLDREMDHPIVAKIRYAIENSTNIKATIADLRLWRVGKNSYFCALSLLTKNKDLTISSIRAQLKPYKEIVRTSIEING